MATSTSDILGKGAAYPIGINGHQGIAMAAGTDKVRRSILTILGTQHGERVMRPKFGCNLRTLVFMPNNRATAAQAEYYVREGLTRWEPRITLDDVAVENDNFHGRLIVHINYRIKATHEPQNLVYPFYLANE